MTDKLPTVYLARHGETAWSLSGRHTGRTDLPLTEEGERQARSLAPRLTGHSFAKVFTSPLQRATKTCDLAGFGAVAQPDPDLLEWDYGDYEGRRTADVAADLAVSPASIRQARSRVLRRLREEVGDLIDC